jgi:hypothetical protein
MQESQLSGLAAELTKNPIEQLKQVNESEQVAQFGIAVGQVTQVLGLTPELTTSVFELQVRQVFKSEQVAQFGIAVEQSIQVSGLNPFA